MRPLCPRFVKTHAEDVSQSPGIIAVFYLIIFSLCAHHKRIVAVFPDDYQDSEAPKMAIVAVSQLKCWPTCLLCSSGELQNLLTSCGDAVSDPAS